MAMRTMSKSGQAMRSRYGDRRFYKRLSESPRGVDAPEGVDSISLDSSHVNLTLVDRIHRPIPRSVLLVVRCRVTGHILRLHLQSEKNIVSVRKEAPFVSPGPHTSAKRKADLPTSQMQFRPRSEIFLRPSRFTRFLRSKRS